MEKKIILSTKGIVKRFPGVVALKGIDLDLYEGEIHSIIGQNGAGKSTFLRIINGIYQPDEGEIYVNGRKVDINNPLTARELGITLVNQELTLLPNLSIMENIQILGQGSKNTLFGKVDYDKIYKITKNLLKELRLDAEPDTKVSELTAGQQQLVQVASALISDAQIICLDEPTSMLSPNEVETLFQVMRELKEKGKTLVFISHKIDEVIEISDRITVFRNGEKIDTLPKEDTSSEKLIELMLGEEVHEFYVHRTKIAHGQQETPILEVRNLHTRSQSSGEVPLKGISFKLYPNEILGITGLLGAGKSEIAKSLLGLTHIVKGEILIHNKPVKIKSPVDALKHGIFYLPEDRLKEGLVLSMSVANNIVLPSLPQLSRWGIFTNSELEIEIASKWVKELNIVTPSIYAKVDNLSGGNKQKVVVARGLQVRPKVLIIDEPTVGIDIGAKVEIRRVIKKLVEEEQQTIILISSDIREVLSLADRVMVVKDGRALGIFENGTLTEEDIIRLIATENNSHVNNINN